MGMVNLLAVLETGADPGSRPGRASLRRGASTASSLFLCSPTGVRILLWMIAHRGDDFTVHEYLNTGGNSMNPHRLAAMQAEYSQFPPYNSGGN